MQLPLNGHLFYAPFVEYPRVAYISWTLTLLKSTTLINNFPGDFTGKSGVFNNGTHQGGDFSKVFKNDEVSSIEVAGGCIATVYQHADGTGWSAQFRPGRYGEAACCKPLR